MLPLVVLQLFHVYRRIYWHRLYRELVRFAKAPSNEEIVILCDSGFDWYGITPYGLFIHCYLHLIQKLHDAYEGKENITFRHPTTGTLTPTPLFSETIRASPLLLIPWHRFVSHGKEKFTEILGLWSRKSDSRRTVQYAFHMLRRICPSLDFAFQM